MVQSFSFKVEIDRFIDFKGIKGCGGNHAGNWNPGRKTVMTMTDLARALNATLCYYKTFHTHKQCNYKTCGTGNGDSMHSEL